MVHYYLRRWDKVPSKFYITLSKKEYLKNKSLIYANNLQEFKILNLLLGNNIIINDEETKEAIDINLKNKKHVDIIKNINFSILDESIVLKCLKRVNTSNFPQEKNSKKLSKKYTHKKNQKNMLIEKYNKQKSSNIYYFYGKNFKTPEINLDHLNNNHTEGIIISEICRQASMATAMFKLGYKTKFLICKEYKEYHNLVNRNENITVQTFEYNKTNTLGSCVFNLFQNNKLCTSGYITGYIIGDK